MLTKVYFDSYDLYYLLVQIAAKRRGPTCFSIQNHTRSCQVLRDYSLLKELHFTTILVWILLACRDANHLNSGSSVWDALDVIYPSDPDTTIVTGIIVNCCSCDIGKYKITLSHYNPNNCIRLESTKYSCIQKLI